MGSPRRPTPEGPTRKFGDAKEKSIAKAGGYKRTPGSGSGGNKGDLRRGNFMVEVKATRAESFRVTAEILAKLRNDSLTNGRPYALIVEIGTGERYAVMPLKTFERLTEDQG